MKLSIYTTALGLMSLATQTTAIPLPQTDTEGMIAAAATVRVMPFGASIVEGVRPPPCNFHHMTLTNAFPGLLARVPPEATQGSRHQQFRYGRRPDWPR
jgi:hypothetical protein